MATFPCQVFRLAKRLDLSWRNFVIQFQQPQLEFDCQIFIYECFEASKLHVSREVLAFSLVHKREVMTCYYEIVTIWYSSDAMSRTTVLKDGKSPPITLLHPKLATSNERAFEQISYPYLCLYLYSCWSEPCNFVLCSTWLVMNFCCRSHILVVDPFLNRNDGLVGVFLVFEHCWIPLALL